MRIRHRVLWSLTAGVVVGILIAASSIVLPAYLFFHVRCEPRALGNVTAWTPTYVAAAPYRGSVSVSEYGWLNTTREGVWKNVTVGFSPVSNSSGNVTAGDVEASNWTVVELQNESEVGPGSSTPCAASLVALHGSPWEWMAGLSPPMGTGLENDQALPVSLNTSWLCYFWNQLTPGSGWYPPACPESSTFHVSFGGAVGTVNTCDSPLSKTVTLNGSAVEVRIPFYWNDRELEVPAIVSMNTGDFSTWALPGLTSFGSSLIFHYSFPVGGVWSYDRLAAGNSVGSGLVFTYRSCPT